MKNENNLSIKLTLAVVLLFTSSTLFINIKFKKPELNPQDSFLNFDPTFLRMISFGHKKFIANILWIKTLLDSDLDHYKERDLKSWMYLRFNTISNLDPYFIENYIFAVQYLSIVKDDLMGAIEIGKKGLAFYPNSYRLNYQLAFTYGFELKEYKKALPYFEKIKDSPKAPVYIKSLILKMKSEAGVSLKTIYQELLHEYKTNFINNHLRSKIENELYIIKSQIDLKCLNRSKQNCDKIDFYGNPYPLNENGFYFIDNTEEYGLKIRK